MKFNLKNRPHLESHYDTYEDYIEFEKQMALWFEGFEKELRTKIEKDKKKMGADLAYYINAKEILGE